MEKMDNGSEQTPCQSMANKHRKVRSTSFVIREMKMKATVRCHYTPMKMAQIQNTNNTCARRC